MLLSNNIHDSRINLISDIFNNHNIYVQIHEMDIMDVQIFVGTKVIMG